MAFVDLGLDERLQETLSALENKSSSVPFRGNVSFNPGDRPLRNPTAGGRKDRSRAKTAGHSQRTDFSTRGMRAQGGTDSAVDGNLSAGGLPQQFSPIQAASGSHGNRGNSGDEGEASAAMEMSPQVHDFDVVSTPTAARRGKQKAGKTTANVIAGYKRMSMDDYWSQARDILGDAAQWEKLRSGVDFQRMLLKQKGASRDTFMFDICNAYQVP